MTIEFSRVITARAQELGAGGGLSAKSVDLQELGERAAPILLIDHFRVVGRPFPPHPHAGFSAVTYVLEDSQSGLRSRSSLGDDVLVGPGGVVWTQAGSGVIHEELPSERGRELHGVQIFVNLSSKNKFAAPQVLQLDRGEAPQWRSDAGDRVRVVIGSFDGVESSLVPIEPFNLLDVELRRSIAFDIPSAFNALVCVLDGGVRVHANGVQRELQRDQAIALHSTGGSVTLEALQPATLLLLSGHQIREPVVIEGNFVMNERSQIVDAVSRFRAGKMGQLAPLSDV